MNGSDTEIKEIEITDKKVTNLEAGPEDYAEDYAEYWSEMPKYLLEVMTSLNHRSKLENVAIFVDYDNVYWSLMNTFQHDPNHIDPNKNLFDKLWEIYGQNNVRSFRAYADFEKIRTNLTSLQKKRIQIRHVYSNGKDGDGKKNSSDIELCIDAIEHTYKNSNVSCYVIVTADSDMIPLISRLAYKGKRVDLYYLSTSAPKHVDITNYVHKSCDLIELLNINVQEINLSKYIPDAIKNIYDWHQSPNNKGKLYGQGWMRDDLSKKLGIPKTAASELINMLKAEGYLVEEYKEVKGKTYPNNILSDNGFQLLEVSVTKSI